MTEQNTSPGDSIAKKIWSGQYIKSLENANQSNTIIDEIVYTSTTAKVLSIYTALICLENEEYVCYDCLDESTPTILSEYPQQDTLKVYPNPFKETINIELQLGTAEEVADLSIVDITGKVVYKIDTSALTAGKNFITCQPTGVNGSELKPGFYILNYATSKRKYSMKILKK